VSKKILRHTELLAYIKAMDAAMQIFAHSKAFPREEVYSLTDQIRRSSRSVCANIAEAWRKRRYEKAFVSKLSDAEGEAAETQVWIEFAAKCDYVPREKALELYTQYDEILRLLYAMISNPENWLIKTLEEESSSYGDPF
jgi:four helix bundle protein